MSIKTLYTFEINKEQEVEKQEQVDGGVLTKKVKEKVPVHFALRKPNRQIIDNAELFYGVQWNEAVKAGLMPRALFVKRLNNDNWIFSDAQSKERESLANRVTELAELLIELSKKPEDERSTDEQKKFDTSLEEYNLAQKRLNDFANAEQSMFENTAENRARNKTIMWYQLSLALIKNKRGEFEDLYPGKTYEEKLANYDKIEEHDDETLSIAARKFSFFSTALYLGRAQTAEDFKNIDDRISSSFAGVIPEQFPDEVPEPPVSE